MSVKNHPPKYPEDHTCRLSKSRTCTFLLGYRLLSWLSHCHQPQTTHSYQYTMTYSRTKNILHDREVFLVKINQFNSKSSLSLSISLNLINHIRWKSLSLDGVHRNVSGISFSTTIFQEVLRYMLITHYNIEYPASYYTLQCNSIFVNVLHFE